MKKRPDRGESLRLKIWRHATFLNALCAANLTVPSPQSIEFWSDNLRQKYRLQRQVRTSLPSLCRGRRIEPANEPILQAFEPMHGIVRLHG
jgi:hypothetical protein